MYVNVVFEVILKVSAYTPKYTEYIILILTIVNINFQTRSY